MGRRQSSVALIYIVSILAFFLVNEANGTACLPYCMRQCVHARTAVLSRCRNQCERRCHEGQGRLSQLHIERQRKETKYPRTGLQGRLGRPHWLRGGRP
ncbi:hypothetical protein H6P81_008245 [Aristolochia fimbriata]|uniref:Uncharacterized protein n=1 Tax=Aristolochia fimbriata TaxID=158543 RepID=A0AAV7F681_ARIFI|nr:hypothetical protein H6P81_008245 [Aristolochia fimbriata]